ncbi:hypothetical protein EYC80_010723 [Monilinia laxa]|uniref:Uncharacterized protein n=1 Tax=Monilinia laxa TaxID=61186 RepID=A0A5N6JNK8_MONLA|nr:hypothetical protein EYC80_010723 [Monilinia laxa]
MSSFLNNPKLLLGKIKHLKDSLHSTSANQKLMKRFQSFFETHKVSIPWNGEVSYGALPEDLINFSPVNTEGSELPQTLVVVYTITYLEGRTVENASLFVENSSVSKSESGVCFEMVKGELQDKIVHRIYDPEIQTAELVYGQYIRDDKTEIIMEHEYDNNFKYKTPTNVLKRHDPVVPLEGEELQRNDVALQQVIIKEIQVRGPKQHGIHR